MIVRPGGTQCLRGAALPAIAMIVLTLAACARKPDPIIVSEGMLVLQNQTDQAWQNVVVTVNDHFRGGVSQLEPGGRLNAPLRDFQTAFGQRFDRGRQSVVKVEVTATDASGAPVRLTWNRRHPLQQAPAGRRPGQPGESRVP